MVRRCRRCGDPRERRRRVAGVRDGDQPGGEPLAGGAKFGANMDQRTVAGTSVTVPATARDTSAPVVNVVAIDAGAEANDVALVQFDATGLDTNNNNTVDTDEIVITSTTAKVPAASQNLANNQGIVANSPTSATDSTPDGTPVALAAGDRITIKSGALVDQAGNKSRARTFTVLAAQASPRITAITMSDEAHTAQAAVPVPASISGATTNTLGADGYNGITISAKKGGDADGAVGNGWTIRFDRASSWKADAKAAVDIGVHVSAKDRLISVRFNAGNAKFADLKAALEANSAFAAMFMVTLPPDANGACGATANNPLQIGAPTGGGTAFARGLSVMTGGGLTAVAIEVRFNAYALSIDPVTNLGDDVFAEVVKRYNAVENEADGTPGSDVGLAAINASSTPRTPATSARYEMVTGRAACPPSRQPPPAPRAADRSGGRHDHPHQRRLACCGVSGVGQAGHQRLPRRPRRRVRHDRRPGGRERPARRRGRIAGAGRLVPRRTAGADAGGRRFAAGFSP